MFDDFDLTSISDKNARTRRLAAESDGCDLQFATPPADGFVSLMGRLTAIVGAWVQAA